MFGTHRGYALSGKRTGGAGGAAAFTLVELMVVVIIIGVLAAVVVPNLFGQVDKANQAKAKADIKSFVIALKAFRADVGRYPTTEEGLEALLSRPSAKGEKWKGPYLSDTEIIPRDPWGNKYVYKSPGAKFEYEIISYGKDGAEGGEDYDEDVTSWRKASDG